MAGGRHQFVRGSAFFGHQLSGVRAPSNEADSPDYASPTWRYQIRWAYAVSHKLKREMSCAPTASLRCLIASFREAGFPTGFRRSFFALVNWRLRHEHAEVQALRRLPGDQS